MKRFGLGLVGVFLFAHLCLVLVIEDDRDTGPAHKTIRPCYDAMRCDAMRMRYNAMRRAALSYLAM